MIPLDDCFNLSGEAEMMDVRRAEMRAGVDLSGGLMRERRSGTARESVFAEENRDGLDLRGIERAKNAGGPRIVLRE